MNSEKTSVEQEKTQSEQNQSLVEQKKKKRTSAKSTLVITDEIRKKVTESLSEMLDEVKSKKQEKPAEILIRENIKFIDELSKSGSTMNQIFDRINRVVKLEISAGSFAVYVRRIKQKFQCEFCEKEAKFIETPVGKMWICEKCKTIYKDKKRTLTTQKISEKLKAKLRECYKIQE